MKKLDKVELKYGRLSGNKDHLKEKNLDTQLSVDMITLASENHYDTAILVSNDGDYQSAVRGVKQLGKRAENVYFKGSISMALKRECGVARRARRGYFVNLPYDRASSLTSSSSQD